jgi:hypothetical protein
MDSIQHDINCLTHENKGTRFQAIKKLETHLNLLLQNINSTPNLVEELNLQTGLNDKLLNLLSDPGDAIRERTLTIISTFVI